MDRCLYCPNEPRSVEHPLPAALGEFQGAPILRDRICQPCNNERLGLLDEQLSRCGPEAFLRQWFGIHGRQSHPKVNPHYRGSAGGRRVEMKAYDESMGMEIELEIQGAGQVRQLCQLIFLDADGSSYTLPLREQMSSDVVLSSFRSLGIRNLVDARLYADPQERVWVEPLLKGAWPNVSFGEPVIGPTVYEGAEIKLQLTDRYFRSVAKIGFHYFLTQFPEFSGAEPYFADIRHYIVEDGHPVRLANKYIGERQFPLLGEMVGGARPDGWVGHVLAAEIQENGFLAHVQLFVSHEYPARAYTISLGKTFATMPAKHSGHAYLYFPDGQHGKYSGIATPVEGGYSSIPRRPLTPVVLKADD